MIDKCSHCNALFQPNLLTPEQSLIDHCHICGHRVYNGYLINLLVTPESYSLQQQAPVVDIYHQFAIESENTPSQMQINTYLTAKSGQTASLTGFLVFLRKTRGVELNCHVANLKARKKSLQQIERKEAEKQLITLINLGRPLRKIEQFEWIQMSLVFFHKKQLSLTAIKKLKPKNCEDGIMVIEIDGCGYQIPEHRNNKQKP